MLTFLLHNPEFKSDIMHIIKKYIINYVRFHGFSINEQAEHMLESHTQTKNQKHIINGRHARVTSSYS